MEYISETCDNLLYKIWRADRDYWQQFTHKKPIYDPFEVCKPSKTFLLEVIKQLKQQCYEINNKKNKIKQDETIPAWLKECRLAELDIQHNKLLRRIKDYRFRCKYNNSSNGINSRSITESDKQRAKDRPISELYGGKLKKAGVRLLGKCPFHDDSTASLVVYPNNTFHCFGCQAGTDSIDFIMKLNNLKFIEAVKLLIGK